MPKHRFSSASTSLSAGSGGKPSTAGSARSRSTRDTPPRITTSPSPTNTRGNSTRRARRTKKRSNSSRTTRRSGRTTSCSRKSMTARAPHKTSKLLVGALAASLAAFVAACGPSSFEIPIETPIQPKLDVSAFQRVLIAGFVAGGSDDVDANQETVRLLRSQLRTKSSLRVIDADVMALAEIAQEQSRTPSESPADEPAAPPVREAGAAPSVASSTPGTTAERASGQPLPLPAHIKDEKDLEPYERLFANTSYWKRIGEEYQ